jgi:hypothetical protein
MIVYIDNIILYSNRDDCDKYVYRMQKNHKRNGIIWGNVKKNTVSVVIYPPLICRTTVLHTVFYCRTLVVTSYVTVPALQDCITA